MDNNLSLTEPQQIPAGMKFCECFRNCGELIPVINKLGKPARFKWGHNTTPAQARFMASLSSGHTGKQHSGDMSRFGKHRLGVPPTNPIQKGQHISPQTEYKKNHVNSGANKAAVSAATKLNWSTNKAYRNKCLNAPRKRKFNTKPELKIQELLNSMSVKFVSNKWVPFGHIPTKKYGCFPDILILGSKIVVFIDGSYWHSSPKQIAKDAVTTGKLIELGYRVVRITEEEALNISAGRLKELLEDS